MGIVGSKVWLYAGLDDRMQVSIVVVMMFVCGFGDREGGRGIEMCGEG